MAASARTLREGDHRCLCALGFTGKKGQHSHRLLRESATRRRVSSASADRDSLAPPCCENKINKCASVSPCLKGGACTELEQQFQMHLPTRYLNLFFLVRLFINEMDLLDRMDRTEVRKGHPQPCLNNDNCINLLGVSSALARPPLTEIVARRPPTAASAIRGMNDGQCHDFGSGLNCNL